MTDAEKAARLDVELVRRGIFASRAQARAAIEAGGVVVDGVRAEAPSTRVRTNAEIVAEPAHPWVSRGGVKLAHALERFGVDVSGRVCLDLGASTGGFTQVLLSRGATCAIAVDVGRGQLHASLSADPRIRSLEATDARSLKAEHLGAAPSLVVCDLSFIGLAKALGPALALAAPKADLVGLFKPQFEVGPTHVGKGGLVTDEDAIRRAIMWFEEWLHQTGWVAVAWTPSPIAGGDGNNECLFHARQRTELGGAPK